MSKAYAEDVALESISSTKHDYVEATGLATFPDGSVSCGPLLR